jgi:hypothetical protein
MSPLVSRARQPRMCAAAKSHGRRATRRNAAAPRSVGSAFSRPRMFPFCHRRSLIGQARRFLTGDGRNPPASGRSRAVVRRRAAPRLKPCRGRRRRIVGLPRRRRPQRSARESRISRANTIDRDAAGGSCGVARLLLSRRSIVSAPRRASLLARLRIRPASRLSR